MRHDKGHTVHRSYARRWRKAPWWRLEAYALQMRSLSVREVFASAATRGDGSSERVRRTAVDARGGSTSALAEIRSFDPRPLKSLARIMANQRRSDEDASDALAIFRLVVEHELAALSKADRYLMVELAADSGDVRTYRDVLAATQLADADVAHAACLSANLVGSPGSQLWSGTLNVAFAVAGLEPVGLEAGGGSAFDRLVVTARPPAVDGPRVSVVMPTFEADDRITTAVRSLLQQSWQNLEILVVDDGSSAPAVERVRRLADEDPRITVLFHERRRGAYAARNTGLRAASGLYVTCHDDDDWSHPRKIEQQATALEQGRGVLASMSRHVRATDDLLFTRVNISPRLPQPNYSSLMFRTAQVREEYGGWDETQKGADAEFKARLERGSGREVPVVCDVPLSFTRHRSGSLSFGEMARGYVDPGRLAHRQAYERWHRAGPASWQVSSDARRPYVLPAAYQSAPGPPPDTVYLDDFRVPGPSTQLLLDRAADALGRGEVVGLLHLDCPWTTREVDLLDSFWELLDAGATFLTLGDEVHARRLVVGDPATLQYADEVPSAVSADLCEVLHDPRYASRKPVRRFDRRTVSAHAQRMFEAPVEWAPRRAP